MTQIPASVDHTDPFGFQPSLFADVTTADLVVIAAALLDMPTVLGSDVVHGRVSSELLRRPHFEVSEAWAALNARRAALDAATDVPAQGGG